MTSPSKAAGDCQTTPSADEVFSRSWRPWSVALEQPVVSRSICGALNRVTETNLHLISSRLALLCLSTQEDPNYSVFTMLTVNIVQRAANDGIRASVYAALCEGIIGELMDAAVDKEKKGKTDLAASFLHSLQLSLRKEFHRAFNTQSARIHLLMILIGELLVRRVLCELDIRDYVILLLYHTYRNDEQCTIAISRFLQRVSKDMSIHALLEKLRIKEELLLIACRDNVTPRVKYLLQASLGDRPLLTSDPVDVFESTRNRADIYGLDPEDLSSENDVGEDRTETDVSVDSICWHQECENEVRSFFATRRLQVLGDFARSLLLEDRYVLVDRLVYSALLLNDIDYVRLAVSFLSLPSTRYFLRRADTFENGFSNEMRLLEDTLLDVPDACIFMATMLHACDMPSAAIRSLALVELPAQDATRQRVLEEYQLLVGRNSGAMSDETLVDHSCGLV